jgi:1-acyl-sn-glycerol-3-phosphate acyltransferase
MQDDNKVDVSWALLRSLLITDPLIIIITLILAPLTLLASLFEEDGRRQIAIARLWSWLVCKVSGTVVEVEGLDHLQPEALYVFASNHLSFLDTPVTQAYLPEFRYLAKEELFRVPIFGYHMREARHIPVTRSDPRGAVKAMNAAAKSIQDRRLSVLIFPEGQRARNGLQPFNEGAAFIAIKAGVPIVPIGISGTHLLLPHNSLNIRAGRVKMTIGKPIHTAGFAITARSELTERVEQEVANLLQRKA